MRKIMSISRVIAVLLAVCVLISPVFAQESNYEDPSVELGCHSLDAKSSLLGPGQIIKNSTSAILYDLNTDTMVYSWNPDQMAFPASLVKILTALIVCEEGTMSEVVTVKQSTLDSVDRDAATADLVADEVLTVEDLMYCMMVGSANDAAAVLAEHVMGSQDAFVERMNAYAQELNCTGTTFKNVHGLHHTEQVTTARDIIKILAAASKNDLFMQFFGATTYTVEATNKSEERKLITGNYLMSAYEIEIYYDSRVIGGRTGATTLGDRCVATVAEKNGSRMLCLIMGARSVYDENGYAVRSFGGFPETSQLLNRGFNELKPVQMIYQDQVIDQYSVVGGDADAIVCAKSSVGSMLPAATDLQSLRYEYAGNISSLSAPLNKGDIVGTLSIWSGNLCVGYTELYLMNQVRVQSDLKPTGTEKSSVSVFQVLFIVVGILVVLGLAIVLALRMFHIKRVNMRRNRNRRNHRRSR